MAPTCRISRSERTTRMALGTGFVIAGFVLRWSTPAAVTMVSVGSAMIAAASLGH